MLFDFQTEAELDDLDEEDPTYDELQTTTSGRHWKADIGRRQMKG